MHYPCPFIGDPIFRRELQLQQFEVLRRMASREEMKEMQVQFCNAQCFMEI